MHSVPGFTKVLSGERRSRVDEGDGRRRLYPTSAYLG